MTKKKVMARAVLRPSTPVAAPQPKTTAHPWRGHEIPPEVFAAAERQGGRVKVRATKMGWYNISRWRAGDVFVILKPEHFSTQWMALEPDNAPVHRTLGKASLAREHADIMRGRAPRLQANAADLESDEPTYGAQTYGAADDVVHPPDPESPLE